MHERVPFIGFAEAFVIKAALNAGVPNHRVRPSILKLREEFGNVDHALAHECVYTDGAEILSRSIGDDEDADLSAPRLGHQRQFRKAVESHLKQITYGGDGYAERLTLPKYGPKVFVDPNVAAGAPIVANGGARVEDLLSRHEAGDGPKALARDYGVPLKQVREVIRQA